ncbi:hypothetical protein [Streptomyces fragilis]|uniref:DUF8017 domain-containing protein n=2 Tax=Streptomyces fragilis TaxID=67301 RepID=A0ABV2YKR1_9ACTN|nr:hypothetical protein [Streptomyces fragilis]
MWPGQQPPGGEQNPNNPQQPVNPYQQPGYQQQPNPYQTPGYQQQPQPGPYAAQGQWGPATPVGPAQPPAGGGPSDPSRRTKLVAIVAASAVVLTAAVTGFLVLGDDDEKVVAGGDGKPSASASASKPASPEASGPAGENPRGDGPKPTVPGWKVVVNPKWGTAFDVPADWEVESSGTFIGFEEDGSDDLEPLIVMSAPAYYKSKWCVSDDDKDGREDETALATVGTKGANGAKSTDEVAINHSNTWVFAGYTQPDKKSVTWDKKAKPYTTAAGVEGSIAWARSKDTPAKGKCATDGKALTFGFKNSNGDFVAWSLFGATGVEDEVSEETIMKVLDTVRLYGTPKG